MAKTKRKTPARKRPATRVVRKSTAQKAKSAPTIKRRPRQEKAAVRSDAFAKAILEAKSYRDDPDSLSELFELASAKVATIPATAIQELGPYLQAMLRLVRAYAHGEYRNIPRDAFLTIVAAVSYLIDPFDLIPDEVPFLGFVDDASIIGFAVSRTRDSLDEFMIWEIRGK